MPPGDERHRSSENWIIPSSIVYLFCARQSVTIDERCWLFADRRRNLPIYGQQSDVQRRRDTRRGGQQGQPILRRRLGKPVCPYLSQGRSRHPASTSIFDRSSRPCHCRRRLGDKLPSGSSPSGSSRNIWQSLFALTGTVRRLLYLVCHVRLRHRRRLVVHRTEAVSRIRRTVRRPQLKSCHPLRFFILLRSMIRAFPDSVGVCGLYSKSHGAEPISTIDGSGAEFSWSVPARSN